MLNKLSGDHRLWPNFNHALIWTGGFLGSAIVDPCMSDKNVIHNLYTSSYDGILGTYLHLYYDKYSINTNI